MIMLDGASLTPAQVSAVARDQAPVAVAEAGRAAAAAAARAAAEVAARQPVYGRTTGVGANRDQLIAGDDVEHSGLRLMRSHAGGGGPLLAPELSRAMLVVRLNQLLAGGSGVDPGVLDVLARGLNAGLSVPVPTVGAIGTGDLTALAGTALCLLGERDWVPATAAQPRFALAAADAPAFMSSNAATIGEAAVASYDLASLLTASTMIAAFSHLAVDGSAEPYAPAVHRRYHRDGQRAVAARMRLLLGAGGRPAARIQDPTGTGRCRRSTAPP